jgi:A/G-specific adenine glycosylase
MTATRIWKAVAAWYRRHGRDLPWRRTADPYRIAVAEFMLQQTQVDRVVPLYRAFIRRFPSWKALAGEEQAEIVRAWKGLGYNLRAVRLRGLARQVVGRFDGRLPRRSEDLLSLKGIGPYTARALRIFAFREGVLAPDTNLRRVLNRLFRGPKADPKRFDGRTWERWETSLPRKLAYDVNQGLMDLGAGACKAGVPRCEECPLRRYCRSYPRILTMRTLPRQKTARKERVDEHGLPNRIYRGRIVGFLREGGIAAAAIDVLGRAVKPTYGRADRPWLLGLLLKLEKDGLIAHRGGRIHLA